MNLSSESATKRGITEQTRLEGRGTKRFQLPATVVIVAPPWPRSGAAWVIKNQIDYYCLRGFSTALVVVPFHRWFMRENPVWEEVKQGFEEVGAERLFLAPLEHRGYKIAKYTTSLRYGFRGTVLEWESAMAKSAVLPESFDQILKMAPVAFMHVNYVQTLGFADQLRRRLTARRSYIPIILETHDVQSHLMQERRELNPWTHKPDQIEHAIRSEISLLKKADVLVHLSVDDLRFFGTRLPSKPHVLAMPAIDEAFISAVKAAVPFDEAIDLLFVGQKHSPNLSALTVVL